MTAPADPTAAVRPPDAPVGHATVLGTAVTVLDHGDDFVVTRMRIDPHDPVFAGHYPQFPIYPGLFLVECAHRSVLAVAALLGRELELAQVESARFHRSVFPGDLVTTDIRFTARERDRDWRCSARLRDGEAELASIRLLYRPPGQLPTADPPTAGPLIAGLPDLDRNRSGR